MHLRRLTDELHLYLLVARLQIANRGKLEPDKLDDPDSYTLRLFDLVSGCRGLARDLEAKLAPIVNLDPRPLWKLCTHEVLDQFGTIAEHPPDVTSHSRLCGVRTSATRRRLCRAKPAVTSVRLGTGDDRHAAEADARGVRPDRDRRQNRRLQNRYAGSIEEPLLSLRGGKPLFVNVGPGGARGARGG